MSDAASTSDSAQGIMIFLGMCYVKEAYVTTFKHAKDISPGVIRDRIRLEKVKELYSNSYIISISEDDHVGIDNVETGHHIFGSFGPRLITKIQEAISNLLVQDKRITFIMADYCRMPTAYAQKCYHMLPSMLNAMWQQELISSKTEIILPNMYHCSWSSVFGSSSQYNMFLLVNMDNPEVDNPLCRATIEASEVLDMYRHESETEKIIQSHPNATSVAFVKVICKDEQSHRDQLHQ